MSFFKLKIILMLSGTIGLITIGEAAFSDQVPPSAHSHQAVPTLTAHSSIAKEYKTTEEFTQDSDLIVVGQFIDKPILKKPRKTKDLPSRVNENDESPQKDMTPEQLMTLLEQRDPGHIALAFSARRVLKGDLSKKRIIVAQRGAIDENSTVNNTQPVSGDTLFKSGSRYILFLKKALPNEIANAGYEYYWLVGSTQGAHRIRNGKVYSRNLKKAKTSQEESLEPEITESLGQKIDGVNEESLLSEIEQKAKLSPK